MPRAPLLAITVLAACGAVPARTPSSPAPAAPVPAAAPDPMSEAGLAADLAWLTAPARAGRGSTAPEARATARWLADQLRAAGYAPIEQPIPAVPGQVNVIAELAAAAPAPATEMPAELIVVAHYDHLGMRDGQLHPGADDNASGVAVALAVARDLQRHPLPAAARVRFLFTGAEELGLLGARAFVAVPPVPLDRVRAVYNLDMVGREVAAGGPPQLAAVGIAGDPDIAAAALDAADEAGLALAPVPISLLRAANQTHRTDDWVFRDAGVYAIHLSTGLSDGYHSPRDTLDQVSVPQTLRIARFLRGLVARTVVTH